MASFPPPVEIRTRLAVKMVPMAATYSNCPALVII
jgi:hypothetical protein